MIEFPATLGHLRDAVARLIDAVGEDAPVGPMESRQPPGEGTRRGAVVGDFLQMEVVYIDDDHVVVGDEANDHDMRLGPGERSAVMVS